MRLNQPHTNGILSLTAGEAISAGEVVCFLNPSEEYDGSVYKCPDEGSVLRVPFGVAMEDVEAGDAFSVASLSAVAGTLKVKLQSAVTKVGHPLTAAPRAKEYVFGQGWATWMIGTALETGVAGELIEFAPATPAFADLTP